MGPLQEEVNEMLRKTVHTGDWVTRELQIVKLPTRKMAVVQARGDPGRLANLVLPALFDTVCALQSRLREEGRHFAIGPLYARWPDMDRLPRDEWLCIWALPVPDDTTFASLSQSSPNVAVEVEVWVYGTVAQILHVGPPCGKDPAIKMLYEFAASHGYEIAGPREELYLPRCATGEQDILVRYPLRKHMYSAPDPLARHRQLASRPLVTV
jgi:hypothetical protein